MTIQADPLKTYALVVGIEAYDLGDKADLDGPAHDAVRFMQWLKKYHVPNENIISFLSPLESNASLLDEIGIPTKPATRDVITAGIDQLSQATGDLLFIFWGGHAILP